MSPRKTILRELSRHHRDDSQVRFTRPSSISGFSTQPDKFQKAVNELLKDRLVDGHKDDEGHMAIAINGHRMNDIRLELRPVWTRPVTWAVLVITLVLVGTAALIV